MKTILVVDDERHIVDLIRLYLEREGFAVLTAADGDEGLALPGRHDPDLVILDLMLPGWMASGSAARSADAATPRS